MSRCANMQMKTIRTSAYLHICSFIVLSAFFLATTCNKTQTNSNSVNKSDTVIISLRRTPCYGYCPTYLIEIYRSGKVVYNGFRNVEKIGVFQSKVSKDAIEKIKMKAKEVKFFEMADEYPVEKNVHISDNPTYITFMNFEGKQKTVSNNYFPPRELKDLENLIDEVTKDIAWEKQAEQKE